MSAELEPGFEWLCMDDIKRSFDLSSDFNPIQSGLFATHLIQGGLPGPLTYFMGNHNCRSKQSIKSNFAQNMCFDGMIIVTEAQTNHINIQLAMFDLNKVKI